MPDDLTPMAPRAALRTRVAVPVSGPKRSSLIPVDVLQDVRREQAVQVARAETTEFDAEPKTVLMVADDDGPRYGQVKADVEVALFALSQVPLFRSLPAASLEALASGARQLEVPDGQVLFSEGDEARSFFVVVDGTLEVLRNKDGREVAVRHARQGEAVGLFGLVAGRQRSGTTRAIGDCTVLELDSAQLQELLNHDDALHSNLLDYFRGRLVEAFIGSKLFTDLLDSVACARLIGRFKHLDLEPGHVLLEPGEVTNLLGVITHGRLVLEDRARPGRSPQHFVATQGQFFSVTCGLAGVPAKLKIVAPDFATLCLLTQKDLHELMVDYPALRSLPARLSTYARQLDRAVFCGTAGVPGL